MKTDRRLPVGLARVCVRGDGTRSEKLPAVRGVANGNAIAASALPLPMVGLGDEAKNVR